MKVRQLKDFGALGNQRLDASLGKVQVQQIAHDVMEMSRQRMSQGNNV